MNIIKSFSYALQGIWYCIKTQRNFRFHIVAALSVIIVSFFYGLDSSEKLWLAFAIISVLVCEMINTAVENAVDIQTREYNTNAKIAKDVAAGAVLITAVLAVIIAVRLFWNVEVIGAILAYFASRPYLWVAVSVYAVIAVFFIIGKNKN